MNVKKATVQNAWRRIFQDEHSRVMTALAITFLLEGVEFNDIPNYFNLKPVTCEKPFTIQQLLNTSHSPLQVFFYEYKHNFMLNKK